MYPRVHPRSLCKSLQKIEKSRNPCHGKYKNLQIEKICREQTIRNTRGGTHVTKVEELDEGGEGQGGQCSVSQILLLRDRVWV